MMSLIVEAVVIAFCVGGAAGAVVTMHLLHDRKTADVKVQAQRYVK